MSAPTHIWQKNLADGFSTAEALLSYLKLPASLANTSAEQQFRTRVPRSFVDRMEPGNPNDPLLLQVLAQHEELHAQEGFIQDPLQERIVNPVEGLIHKYQGRVLLTLTGTCAINCRYCFRRHFPYHENNPGRLGWQKACDYIASNHSIKEVILSGGDPLLANDALLRSIIQKLEKIPHLRTLRIHSRIPVVLPERINDSLLQILSECKLHKVVVLHSNHPRELDAQVAIACAKLREANCHLLNQSVLLANINDDANVLAALSERLFECGVLPYYLHLLDKVQGASHFEISIAKAKTIFHTLQSLLSGYLVPRLAFEESGKKNKTLVV